MSLKTFTFNDAVQGKIVGASGTKYLFESELSATRYFKIQEYILEINLNKDPFAFLSEVKRAYDALNDGKGPRIADASTHLKNLLEHVPVWSTQYRKAIMACALFLNREDDSMEKRTAFDETDLMVKVADLEAAYGVMGFIDALPSIMNGLMKP
jgi:hypothetical protein